MNNFFFSCRQEPRHIYTLLRQVIIAQTQLTGNAFIQVFVIAKAAYLVQ